MKVVPQGLVAALEAAAKRGGFTFSRTTANNPQIDGGGKRLVVRDGSGLDASGLDASMTIAAYFSDAGDDSRRHGKPLGRESFTLVGDRWSAGRWSNARTDAELADYLVAQLSP